VEHDINTLVLSGGRALTAACEWGGHVEVAKYLISKGADLEGRADRDAFTPLVAAAYQGHTDLVKLLIACGADIHVDHGAPLEWAALFDQAGAVKALLDAGADPDEKLGHDNTALISAASKKSNQRAAIVKALLDAGADVNGRGMSGVTALHEAAKSGRLDVVKLLLDNGADVNGVDDSGNTPVLRAAEAGQLKVLCLLAERGADLDHRNAQGKTAREILSEMLLSLK
jgi:ankyrin repeat protein